jgi:DNA-directed RNA polymerase specialized sigma24 family protein
VTTAIDTEYAAWLERVDMTRESIANCCVHRLQGDRAAAERVSIEVIGGLLARPRVFQYFGLPFSGRVAHLAELGLARARDGAAPAGCSWTVLRAALAELPGEHRETVVLACVEGYDDAHLAEALGCDESAARERREAALERLREMAWRAAPALEKTKEAT